MRTQLSVLASLLLVFSGTHAFAIGATWTSADTGAKTATATLGPSAVSVSNLTAPSITSGSDFSTSDYSAAPLSAPSSCLSNYGVGSNYTAVFTFPVSGLLIYAQNWRGNGTNVDPVIYTFNHPVEILSGFAASSTSGNTLIVPGTGFQSGILRFKEPVGTLVQTMNTASTQGQILSFGVVPVSGATVAVTGAAKPKTKRKTYLLRGTADATYGIRQVQIQVGKAKGFKKAKGNAQWSYKVKLAPGRNKVRVQAVSNTGETSAARSVVITRK